MKFFPKKILTYRTSLKKEDIFNFLKNHSDPSNIILNEYSLNILDNFFSFHNFSSRVYRMGLFFSLFCSIKETADWSILSVQMELKIQKKFFVYYILIFCIYSYYNMYTWFTSSFTTDFFIFTAVYCAINYWSARFVFNSEAQDLKKEFEKIFENKLVLEN